MTTLVSSTQPFSLELRIRFPLAGDESLPATQVSGVLAALSTGSDPAMFFSIWYEKDAVSSKTGTLYVTSSAGRLQLGPAPIFNDHFYNISVVKSVQTGSFTLSAIGCEDGEVRYSSSSIASTGSVGFPFDSDYTTFSIGMSGVLGEFWAQEARVWNDALTPTELSAHAMHFESYGRSISYGNRDLAIHWRLNDGTSADASGTLFLLSSVPNGPVGTGSFHVNSTPFTKFLEDYAYIPSMDYGWNQEKVRTFSGSRISPLDAYHDERFVSLEFNMYDALNEDISHIMTSYDELTRVIGMPVNRYREDYEGLRQMRETYFKRLQGRLNFRVFVDMLDFFDSSFSSIVERLLPARSSFRGDEMNVESHMLERPKYQYQLRPVIEGRIEVSGSIAIVDRGDDFD
jgi:hypothetical protein